jgi:hypothetical protein
MNRQLVCPGVSNCVGTKLEPRGESSAQLVEVHLDAGGVGLDCELESPRTARVNASVKNTRVIPGGGTTRTSSASGVVPWQSNAAATRGSATRKNAASVTQSTCLNAVMPDRRPQRCHSAAPSATRSEARGEYRRATDRRSDGAEEVAWSPPLARRGSNPVPRREAVQRARRAGGPQPDGVVVASERPARKAGAQARGPYQAGRAGRICRSDPRRHGYECLTGAAVVFKRRTHDGLASASSQRHRAQPLVDLGLDLPKFVTHGHPCTCP